MSLQRQVSDLKTMTNFGKAEIEALLAQFKRKASAEAGMNAEEFHEYMRVMGVEDPNDSFMNKAFLSMAHNGRVNFKELVMSLSILLRGDQEDMAEFEFSLWDDDSDGLLSQQEFINFFKCERSTQDAKSGSQLEADALKSFKEVDTEGKGAITLDQFKTAIATHSLKMGDAFYDFIHDPLNHRASKGAVAAFSAEERGLLLLLSERINLKKGESVPYELNLPDGSKYQVFYLLLSGQLEVSSGADKSTVLPGQEGFVFEELVFRDHTDRVVTAASDAVTLRIPASDFMQSYLSDAGGASAIWNRLKARMAAGKVPARREAGAKVLTPGNINKNLVEMQYAVRGLVPLTAERIQQEMTSGKSSKPFSEILYCNIGNPHSVGQKPITFYREVLSLVDCPSLLEKESVGLVYPPDVITRAKSLLAVIKGGTGAYSHSQGIADIRKHVAEFIQTRDGHPCNFQDLFLTNGASTGIQMILSAVINEPTDAILVPIPQYPIYSALIKLLNGTQVGYYMDEASGWSLDMSELRQQIKDTRARGCTPKALVIINPGNPVGNCLSYENLVDLVKLCKEDGLLLLSDEVYQDNVYKERPFFSVKKVVRDLGKDFDGFEFVSFHSTSKGIIGECGRRGGYMELCGMDPEVQAQIYKLASSGLCSNLDGQVMVDLMVKPPVEGDVSYDLWKQETSGIFNGLKRKSEMLYTQLNAIEGITCQPLQGAMYAFPSITLPPKAIEKAKSMGHAPDTMYALSLLEQTGICAVPGSGFGQKEGTFHIRMTFLPSEDKLSAALVNFKKHHEEFIAKYT